MFFTIIVVFRSLYMMIFLIVIQTQSFMRTPSGSPHKTLLLTDNLDNHHM